MADDPSRLLAGRIILSGMVSLFVGLALIVVGMLLLERMGIAAGNGVLAVGKILTGLCLPLVAFGALMRIVSPEPTADDSGTGDEK